MSFWSDASPVTKGAIVLGPILIIAAIVFTMRDPGGSGEATVQQRGLSGPPAAEGQ